MKLSDKIRNSKGLNTIELVIITLTVLVIICATIDYTIIMRKQNAVSTTVNYVARTIGKQGGVREGKPANFTGEYFNSASLYNDVKKIMNDADIKDSDWVLTIKTPRDGTKTLTSTTNLSVVEKGNDMEVSLTVNYYWKLASQVSPLKIKGTNNAKRISTSTFKLRESDSSNSTVN